MEAKTLLQPSLINYLDLSIQIGERIGERTYRLSIAGEEEIGCAEGEFHMPRSEMEWTADYYAADYYATSPSSNPKGPATGYGRVVRGGTWWDTETDLRTTRRRYKPANAREAYLGFRCARNP